MVGVEAMANWKRLTSPSGDTIYLNLDVMIGMQRNPDINITFLQSVSEPSVKIEVRETPDEILSLRATYRCDLKVRQLGDIRRNPRASSLVSSLAAERRPGSFS